MHTLLILGGIVINIQETKHISVLNYNDNCVCINIAPGKSTVLEAAIDGQPTTIPLTLDEIRYANNGTAFRTGNLEFPEDIEDDLYDELRIDKSKVLKISEIRDILLNPTKEGLIKIISISTLSDFDRVRGQFQKLKSEGYRLTLDMANVIDTRTRELFNNQIKSNISIDDADVVPSNKKVEELEHQLAEMKALLLQMNASKQEDKKEVVDTASTKTEEVKTVAKSTRKSPGRPRKN